MTTCDGGWCADRAGLPRSQHFLDEGFTTEVEIAIVPRVPPVCRDVLFARDFDGQLFEILDVVVMPFFKPDQLSCEPLAEIPAHELRPLGRMVSLEELAPSTLVRDP